ncbi:MAG: branched-chain amino acid ABC transporter substrate-binding protein [Candidatus Coatesbacteria bacterium]|nr:MAG: branched-chain amino acid ABC transporter substrate-binding protein [Candidatus Coatesbacteria bacterium]
MLYQEVVRLNRILVIVLISILVLSLTLITTCGKKGNEIVIGVAGPFTGDGAQFGDMIRKGATMMMEKVNSEGGIDGRMIKLVFEDDKGDPREAALVAQKLASDPEVVAVVGHFNSSCSKAAKPIYKQMRIVELSPGSTNKDVCIGSEWTFRDVYRDDFQGYAIADYIHDILGKKRVAIFYDNDDYGRGLMEFFVERAKELGMEIVRMEAYTRDTQEFTPQLTNIKKENPEIIFISGLYTQAAMICAQARRLGIDIPFMGGDGLMSSDLIKIGGDAVEGIVITCPFIPEMAGEGGEEFVSAFEKKYGEPPDAWAALTYDAVGIIVKAIKEVGTDREKIKDYLATMTTTEKGYKGVTGTTVFDENGDCIKPLFVATVVNGEFIPAEKQFETE